MPLRFHDVKQPALTFPGQWCGPKAFTPCPKLTTSGDPGQHVCLHGSHASGAWLVGTILAYWHYSPPSASAGRSRFVPKPPRKPAGAFHPSPAPTLPGAELRRTSVHLWPIAGPSTRDRAGRSVRPRRRPLRQSRKARRVSPTGLQAYR